MPVANVNARGGGGAATTPDLRNLEKVRGILASLGKFINAQAIYQRNNPNYIKSANAFEDAIRAYFATDNELLLTIEQYQLIWRDQVVYDIGRNTESIAFLLYKDGIGELSVHPSVQRNEIERLAQIICGALYNPSAQFDTATAFWEAEFPNIFYRVLDEQADRGSGEGDAGGNAQREETLRASDHRDLEPDDASQRRNDNLLDSLGWHFNQVLEHNHPGLSTSDRESRLQALLAEQLSLDPDELVAWLERPRAETNGDELVLFLGQILEFTQMRSSPPVARDINNTITRLVQYLRDEAHLTTLTATLELAASLDPKQLDGTFSAVPARIETELLDTAYLMSLVQGIRGELDGRELLRYLSLAGSKATAPVCELLARSTDVGVHEQGCEMLYLMAADQLEAIANSFDVENPLLANDAVVLLSRIEPAAVAPVIHRMLASTNGDIRQCPAQYLVGTGSDEAARLVCNLLNDSDSSVRIAAYAALGQSANPIIVREVKSRCFADETSARSSDEQEAMFRALGKAAGVAALPRLQQSIAKKHYLSVSKNRGRREKLLAITALRYIGGDEAAGMIRKLATDPDNLVKAKAQHVLKRPAGQGSDVFARETLASTDAMEEP